jgi:rfaE bifunctional protein nucleotidyltransferase chain/domain/rfaE bifunctional protein kinase chain/domain
VSRVTVVGDLLLDVDIVGSVERVCPDAPAPVLDVEHEVARPGGAGLAAALLAADGHDVTLVTALADDSAGRRLASLLADSGVRLTAMPTPGTTREKVRVRAGSQSLVRIDRGTSCRPLPPMALEAVRAIGDCDAILVSDYAGGVLADDGVRAALTSTAGDRPVVWDPHVRGSEPVPGVRLLTPNAVEAAALARMRPEDSTTALTHAARCGGALLARWSVHAVCVTLGARGALLTYGSGAPLVVPAPGVEGGDTCGAGDRFASAAAAVLARGEVVSAAVEHAVAAASVFVATGGAGGFDAAKQSGDVVPGSSGRGRLEQVRAAGGTVVATGGCFDLLHAGHIALLRAARGLGDALVVCVNSDDSVRRLKGVDRPLVPAADRVRVLEALECVDAVLVFDEDTPVEVLRRLQPDVWAKGGDYALADLPEAAVLSEWGGQTVVLPYLDGRSTTALIGAARARDGNGKDAS